MPGRVLEREEENAGDGEHGERDKDHEPVRALHDAAAAGVVAAPGQDRVPPLQRVQRRRVPGGARACGAARRSRRRRAARRWRAGQRDEAAAAGGVIVHLQRDRAAVAAGHGVLRPCSGATLRSAAASCAQPGEVADAPFRPCFCVLCPAPPAFCTLLAGPRPRPSSRSRSSSSLLSLKG